MSEENATRRELLLEQWRMAGELHRHEDQLTWERFGHFGTITGVLVSGLAVAWSMTDEPDMRLWITAAISLVGAVISFVWCRIQARAKVWHEYRIIQGSEAEEELAEDALERGRVLSIYEKALDKQKKVRVPWLASKSTHSLMLFMEGFFCLLWLLVLFLCAPGLGATLYQLAVSQ